MFAALAWAYPHLSADDQKRVKAYLAEEWKTHPPFTRQSRYDPREGERREWFAVPRHLLPTPRSGPHPIDNLPAICLYAEHCGEWDRVLAEWPKLRKVFRDSIRDGWGWLDPKKGSLIANRYLAALLCLAKLAQKAGDAETARQAEVLAQPAKEALVAWWRRSAAQVQLAQVPSIKEWDEFINRGDGLFFKVVPHRSKLALFQDLTPEVAALVRAGAPQAVETVWRAFSTLCPTWHLQGEERQVHYGENYVDPPDFAQAAFAVWPGFEVLPDRTWPNVSTDPVVGPTSTTCFDWLSSWKG